MTRPHLACVRNLSGGYLMIRHVGILCLFLLVTWPASGSAQTGSVTGSVVDQTVWCCRAPP